MPSDNDHEGSEGGSPQGLDEATVLAAQEERRGPGPSVRLTELVREQEAASRIGGLELSDAARASAEAFQKDVATLNEQARIELDRLNEKWPTELESPAESVDSDLLHVFGPGSGPHSYKYEFVWPVGTTYAGVNLHTGELYASDYTLGPPKWTVAQIGGQLKPQFQRCKLSIRPYIRWSGYDILSHRVHDPSSHEQRSATALASTGICVESWDAAGGSHIAETPYWRDEWVRYEINPSGSREYEGVTNSSTLQAETLGLADRWYAIWILCRVHVSADPGFAVSTTATSAISCKVPFFVVEETPL